MRLDCPGCHGLGDDDDGGNGYADDFDDDGGCDNGDDGCPVCLDDCGVLVVAIMTNQKLVLYRDYQNQ